MLHERKGDERDGVAETLKFYSTLFKYLHISFNKKAGRTVR